MRIDNVQQFLVILIGSGILTALLSAIRPTGIPDNWMPVIAHAIAVIAAIGYVTVVGPWTVVAYLSAILAGLTIGIGSAGIHSQLKHVGPDSSNDSIIREHLLRQANVHEASFPAAPTPPPKNPVGAATETPLPSRPPPAASNPLA